MPIIKKSAALAAGASVDNVLQGSVYEFLPSNASIEFGLQGSAAGLVATVQSGMDVLMEESPVSSQNRFPVYPDDFDLVDVGAAGERLKVAIRNPTGGALTYFVTVRVNFI